MKFRSTKRPTTEIDARPFRDYTAKLDHSAKEPIMAPGGWLVLLSFFAVVTIGVLYSHFGRMILAPIVEPSVAWVMSFVR